MGWKSNILLRATFEDMYKDGYGADGAKTTLTDMLKADLLGVPDMVNTVYPGRWGRVGVASGSLRMAGQKERVCECLCP